MSSCVVDALQKGRNEKIRSYILCHLATDLSRGYNYKYFCIVEGKSDFKFYSNINSFDLKNNVRYLWNYRNDKTVENIDVGKDAVIANYNMIRKNPKFNRFMSKYIFIIDHDYDGAKSMKYNYDKDRESKMSITPFHSYENFFLEENNIKKIFYYLGKSESDIEQFETKYKQFIKETGEFVRLKSSTIEVRKKGSPCYDYYINPYRTPLNDISTDIFEFNFDSNHYNDNYFNKSRMIEEIIRMTNYINQYENQNALIFYRNYSKNIGYNRSYVRGHEAMNFLISYLRDVFDIELCDNPANELFCKLANIIDVNFKFVNGLGIQLNK